jgi:hypothetical protein
MNGAMQGHHGLASASRTRHARRPVEISGDKLALLGVEEDSPLVPRCVHRAFKFFDAGHYAEPALCVGMCERVSHGTIGAGSAFDA